MFRIIIQVLGGLTVAFAVLHMLLWRIFNWKEDLAKLSYANRAIVQTMNIALIYLFLFFGILSLSSPDMLLSSTLGRVILAALAGFWAVRAITQATIFRLSKPISIVLTIVFALMAIAYVVVLV